MVQVTTDAPLPCQPAQGRRAFTLLELLVTTIILILLLAGLGLIFRTSSAAVGMSEANLELLANVRAAQEQMQRDFSSLDRSAFLVIRCRKLPHTPGRDEGYYCDQVSFIANESFPNQQFGPTGVNDQRVQAGLIWYGHLVVEGVNRLGAHDLPVPDQSKPLLGPPDQPLDVLPSGATYEDLILGRHVTLLAGPNGPRPDTVTLGNQVLPAVPLPSAFSPPIDVGESIPAHISSSRISLAAISTSQLMQLIQYNVTTAGPLARVASYDRSGHPPPFTETATCFRFKTLLDPLATEVKKDNFTSLPNGVARMSSIFLQSCESFHVEVYVPALQQFKAPDGYDRPAATGDNTIGVYSFDTPVELWPSAVRITMRIADPTHRLPGIHSFQQIISLPR
ncbi:MAG TPA: hypothetical protein VHQ47_05225 [Phycisphaerae bacterium]|nr:hypothetical protein [Phycisphaerae bacterium]